MEVELTIRVDGELLERVKAISEKQGTTISKVVENSLRLLDKSAAEAENAPDDLLTPKVRALKGALRGARVDEADYYKYLEEKYR